MKDYTQIEHINKYIEERMKHCYDIGYEQGRKDERKTNEELNTVVKAFAEGLVAASLDGVSLIKTPVDEICNCDGDNDLLRKGDIVNVCGETKVAIITKVETDTVCLVYSDGSVTRRNMSTIRKTGKSSNGFRDLLKRLENYEEEQ